MNGIKDIKPVESLDVAEIDVNWDKIRRFANAAGRGGPAGSGGEQRAHRLALLMSRAIEEAVGTDMEVVEGAALMMLYAQGGGNSYGIMRELLNKAGYRRAKS